MTAEARLEVRSLTKRFAGVCAVDGVSFSVGGGRVHAVIGPNGAGKTTLFNLITGFESPTAGEVRFDGPIADLVERDDLARAVFLGGTTA